jgi:hypothetical protein
MVRAGKAWRNTVPTIVKRLSDREAMAALKIGFYRKPLELQRACSQGTVDCEQLARVVCDVLTQQGILIVKEKEMVV